MWNKQHNNRKMTCVITTGSAGISRGHSAFSASHSTPGGNAVVMLSRQRTFCLGATGRLTTNAEKNKQGKAKEMQNSCDLPERRRCQTVAPSLDRFTLIQQRRCPQGSRPALKYRLIGKARQLQIPAAEYSFRNRVQETCGVRHEIDTLRTIPA